MNEGLWDVWFDGLADALRQKATDREPYIILHSDHFGPDPVKVDDVIGMPDWSSNTWAYPEDEW